MRVLLGGFFGARNLGDEAILRVWLQALKAHHEVRVLSRDPSWTKKVQKCEPVPRNPRDILENIQWCEALFFPGGSLFQDKTSLRSLLFYAWLVLLAKLGKKKIFFYAQGLGPFLRPLSLKLTLWAFAQAERRAVRDKESRRVLELARLPALEVLDPAYTLPQNPLLKKLSLFVPYRRLGHSLIPEPAPSLLTFLFSTREDSPLPGSPFAPWKELVNPFPQAELCITARLHAAIFAQAAGVPFFLLTHDPKLSSFAKKFALAHAASPHDPAISQSLSLFLEQKDGLRAELKNTSSELRERAQRDLFDFQKLAFSGITYRR